MMRHIFIVNPVAGDREGLRFVREHAPAVFGDDYGIHVTEGPGHAAELAAELGGPDARLYAVGGDGTLNEVARGMRGRGGELCCVPTGTGNDLIRSLDGYEKRDFLDLGRLARGSAVGLDLMDACGRLTLNSASVGFDAMVNWRTNRFKSMRLGGAAYSLAVVVSTLGSLRYDLTLELDGSVIEGRYLLVAACNGRHYGGGFTPAPDARLDDGLMDVVAIKTVSPFRLLSLLDQFRKGLHVRLTELVDVYRVKRCRIAGKKPLVLQYDGESMSAGTVDFSILPDRLRFILPIRE